MGWLQIWIVHLTEPSFFGHIDIVLFCLQLWMIIPREQHHLDLAFEQRISDNPGSVFIFWSWIMFVLLAMLSTDNINVNEMQLPKSWSKLYHVDPKHGTLSTGSWGATRVPGTFWFRQLWSFTHRSEAYRQNNVIVCCVGAFSSQSSFSASC